MEIKIYYDEEILITDGAFKGIKGYIVEIERNEDYINTVKPLAKVKVDGLNVINVPLDYIKSDYEDYLIYVKDIETREITEIIGKKRLMKDDLLNYIGKLYNDMCKRFEVQDYSIIGKWIAPYNKYSVVAQPISELELKLGNYILKPDMIKKIWL